MVVAVDSGAPATVVLEAPVVVVVDARRADRRQLGEHRPEAQLGGLADEAPRLVAVLHAGEVDDDVVALRG